MSFPHGTCSTLSRFLTQVSRFPYPTLVLSALHHCTPLTCSQSLTQFNSCVPAAEAVPIIVSQLTSGVILESFLFQYVFQSTATLKQRAAVLRLLHMLLAPHLELSGPVAQHPANAGSSSSSRHDASVTTVSASAQPQGQADSQESVDLVAGEQNEASPAGQASPGSKSVGPQQHHIKLFTMVLETLPCVIERAFCRSSSDTESNSDEPAVSDAPQAQGAENQGPQEQQEAEAEVADANARQALLLLILHVATDYGLQGMLCILAFPSALEPILPQLLASPQVSSALTASVSLFPGLCNVLVQLILCVAELCCSAHAGC